MYWYVRSNGSKVKSIRAFVSPLLSRCDWVYLLSLLIPFSVYNLALKALTIEASFSKSAPKSPEAKFMSVVYLMESEVFFSLGYAMFWIGLFALAKTAPLRRVVVILFHVVTILVM